MVLLNCVRIWPDSTFSTLDSFLCFCLDSAVLDLTVLYVFLWTPWFSGYMSCDFLIYVSCFTFPYSLCFPHAHYVLLFHFLRLCSSPWPYLIILLIILRSHSCILLWHIQSLVYISCVLVLQTSELILLVPLLDSLRLPLEHLETPAWPWSSLVSSCLDLVSPAHILVWIVNSYPLDLFTCLPLGIEFSGCGMY